MNSRWLALKPQATAMRLHGASIRDIEKQFLISRSTLSNWFKTISLSDHHQKNLQQKRRHALIRARKKAVIWHNEQKAYRLIAAENQATETLKRVGKGHATLELALAMLYLGEGTKSQKGLVLGNSNPNILKFFLAALQTAYNIDSRRLRCELHLRADQKSVDEILYWSQILSVPKTRFKGVYIDKRTVGKTTFPSYHGVCVLSYGDVAIQRKLMYLYELYCQGVVQTRTRSSVGRARL